MLNIPRTWWRAVGLKGREVVIATGTSIAVRNRYTDHRMEFRLDEVEGERPNQS